MYSYMHLSLYAMFVDNWFNMLSYAFCTIEMMNENT